MSPNIHKEGKKQFNIRMDDDFHQLITRIMEDGADENMTELVKRLLLEEAKRKGIKK